MAMNLIKTQQETNIKTQHKKEEKMREATATSWKK